MDDNKLNDLSDLLKETINIFRQDRDLAKKNYNSLRTQLDSILDKDLEGLAHISEITMADGEKLEEKFKIGDELKVKVVKVDSIQHKIALSLKNA